tara:strand:- start:802 stop:1032 length:231 start_codon:yes stop_codon:yes gene_type:complete
MTYPIETKTVLPVVTHVTITLPVTDARLLRRLCGAIGGDGVGLDLYLSPSVSRVAGIRKVTETLYGTLKSIPEVAA